MKIDRLKRAETDIIEYLDGYTKKVFTFPEISGIVNINRIEWRLTKKITIKSFIEYFVNNGLLEKVEISELAENEEEERSRTIRYVWKEASDLEIAVSLKKGSYLSHYSAIYIHGLTSQIPKTIYTNYEQPFKQYQETGLIQENITRAFQNKVRTPKKAYYFRSVKTVIRNGMYTGNLGVGIINFEKSELLVTDIERTLIDISVRPVFSGGIYEVLKTYEGARGGFSINRLLAYLKSIDFIYPYHQVIGFYLEKAGYAPALFSPFKEIGLEYDFYLTHKMDETDYVKEWRLFVPKGF